MNYEEKIEFLIDSGVITKPTTMVSLIDNMYNLSDREKKLSGIVKELCLFKIYDDYKFTTDQNKNYYAQPVIFPLDEFENLNRRAREVLKEMGVEL